MQLSTINNIQIIKLNFIDVIKFEKEKKDNKHEIIFYKTLRASNIKTNISISQLIKII